MTFEELLKNVRNNIDIYNFPEEAMKIAWESAIEQAEIIIAEKYDEQEPWLEPNEISKILIGNDHITVTSNMV